MWEKANNFHRNNFFHNILLFQLTKHFKTKSLSPVDVAERCLENAKALRDLNCFTRLTPDEAKAQANESTKRYEADTPIGPIDGVPIGIKDNFCVANIPTTCGSKWVKQHYRRMKRRWIFCSLPGCLRISLVRSMQLRTSDSRTPVPYWLGKRI